MARGIKITFQNAQWIQLLVPKNNVSIFYENAEDKSIIIRENNFEHYQHNLRQGHVVSEIWCKVKTINDIFIE